MFGTGCARGCGNKGKPNALASASASASAATPLGPPPPKGLPPIPAPADNPITAAKIALGWQLFFDPRLSPDGTRSCNSCHHVVVADGQPTATPPVPGKIVRDAPALLNAGYKRLLFWDGRATALEQAVETEWAALGADPKVSAANLAKVGGYRSRFEAAFPGASIDVQTVARAIATALRSYVCADSAFDRHSAGDDTAMTLQQLAGWQLFQGKARCVACHAPPFFSDAYGTPGSGMHHTGVGIAEPGAEGLDPGRAALTHAPDDVGRFVTPSLRNVTRTAPYFHDGSAHSASAAVIFMGRGGREGPHRDKALEDHALAPSELQSILDFLEALECETRMVRPALPAAATPAP
jgi:cytochrome c peroxidase